MNFLSNIIQEAIFTLKQPREGAKRVLSWDIPSGALWPLVALSVVLSTLVTEFNAALNPPAPGTAVLYMPPVSLALMLGSINVAMAYAIARIGRGFGGIGTFRDALILNTWQQFIWFGVLFALSLLSLIAAPISTMLSIAFGFYMIWILSCFTATLHGFSLLQGAMTTILGSIAAAVIVIGLIGVFGVSINEVAGG